MEQPPVTSPAPTTPAAPAPSSNPQPQGGEPQPHWLKVFRNELPKGNPTARVGGGPAAPPTAAPQGSPTAAPPPAPVAPVVPPQAPIEGGTPTPAAPQVPATPAGPGPGQIIQMDEAGIQRLVQGVVQHVAPPQQPEPTITQADLERQFNVFTATDQHLQALGIDASPERVAVLNGMLQAVAKQAATISAYQVEMFKSQLASELEPIRAMVNKQRGEEIKNEFYQKYPNLKRFEPLLLKIHNSFVQQGRKFQSKEEAFKAVADEATEMMKSMGVNPAATPAAAPAVGQPGATTPSTMPTLSSGGQGGVGDASAAGKTLKKWQKILAD